MSSVCAVLFDLDGTLLDTAPDLIYAVNQLRKEAQLPVLPTTALRPLVGIGSKAMIKMAFGIDEKDPEFLPLRERFLSLYQKHLADTTQFFPGIDTMLTQLESKHIPWGIVTNKLTRHTTDLLRALRIDHRPACVVCGDSLPTFKPDPAPLLYACQLLQQLPEQCIYVGDTEIDVKASKAAGITSLVALYGYIHADEDPLLWQADGYVQTPDEIMAWVK